MPMQVLVQSFLTHKKVKELLLNFTNLLIIFVIRYTSKRRILIEDFAYVYIGHEPRYHVPSEFQIRHDDLKKNDNSNQQLPI